MTRVIRRGAARRDRIGLIHANGRGSTAAIVVAVEVQRAYMAWIGALMRGLAFGRGAASVGASGASRRPRRQARDEEPLGMDGAPGMAFTDTMPGYVQTIDLPSPADRAHDPDRAAQALAD